MRTPYIWSEQLAERDDAVVSAHLRGDCVMFIALMKGRPRGGCCNTGCGHTRAPYRPGLLDQLFEHCGRSKGRRAAAAANPNVSHCLTSATRAFCDPETSA